MTPDKDAKSRPGTGRPDQSGDRTLYSSTYRNGLTFDRILNSAVVLVVLGWTIGHALDRDIHDDKADNRNAMVVVADERIALKGPFPPERIERRIVSLELAVLEVHKRVALLEQMRNDLMEIKAMLKEKR
jgi:hypothetical protein